ncbi:response regulator transcription factor [Terricaulis sp.]|uniref:response regulator transcription factor n=1 Tax=Terricaulis sp. TaxID=2768686 RepID=UPI0037844BF0
MGNELRILIVEDDRALRMTLAATLKAEGYVPAEAGNIAAAGVKIEERAPDLIILDLGLPDGDGMEFLAARRALGDATPVIVLTARSDEKSKVRALDMGADDYVTKPFGIAELIARVRSALRHGIQRKGGPPIVKSGDVEIDLARRLVKKHGSEVKLSRKEFDLLAELALNQGNPVAHDALLRAVWGAPDADIRYLRIYVGQVREKIEDDPQHPRLLLADQGFGYHLT